MGYLIFYYLVPQKVSAHLHLTEKRTANMKLWIQLSGFPCQIAAESGTPQFVTGTDNKKEEGEGNI